MTDMTENARDMIDLSRRPDPEPAADAPSAPSSIPAEELERITADVVEAMKTVFDPEIPVDIYELGLIYKVDLDDDRTMHITMTLTAPGCPVAGEMPMWVHDAAAQVEGVEKVKVELVFEPPWTPDRMTDEARLALNML
ncbi:SUF system Fe-S cluster assembly protein [Hyphobacterium indicum]|jgi:FeS assembly SUF system protein|uniref:SUF system Fe-S cluster assembly protein n=1 Tax=Hyphobacterium indicum TaxID=2162714 RepID=UPI001F1E12AF|nr:SUF system Fe-S cluster assembly protein [Hyphobacterium indicum]